MALDPRSDDTFPSARSPIIQPGAPGTNLISTVWYRFLVTLWSRTTAGVPTGTIAAWAGAVINTPIPDGWIVCQGAAVSRRTYAALFAVIATGYGAGDGSTTFNVPNLAGAPAGSRWMIKA